MESAMGNEGINKLTEVLQNRMHMVSEKPQVLDFGVIQEDMSLLTNKFPIPIPQSDYMVCRQLTLGLTNENLVDTAGSNGEKDGTHNHGSSGGHIHDDGKHLHENGEHIHEDGKHIHESCESCADEDGEHVHEGGSHIHDKGEHTHDGGEHVHLQEGAHVHCVPIPESMRKLLPGDRVLVAWVGDDACVIDIVLPATVI